MGSPVWIDPSDNGQLKAWISGVLTDLSIALPTELLDLIHGQIKFPATQNPSSNANTLDDYERGSWTPVLGGTGGESGQTYATQLGRYVKVGRLVFCEFLIIFTEDGTINGDCEIKGLPFTVDTSVFMNGGGIIGNWQGLATAVSVINLLPITNSTIARVYISTGNSVSSVASLNADVGNTAVYQGSLMYQASA